MTAFKQEALVHGLNTDLGFKRTFISYPQIHDLPKRYNDNAEYIGNNVLNAYNTFFFLSRYQTKQMRLLKTPASSTLIYTHGTRNLLTN